MIALLSKSLSARDRRALQWGGAIVGAALVFVLGVKPYVAALRNTRSDLSVQLDLLARERAVVSEAKKFSITLERSRSSLDEQSAPLFDAPEELAATSDLSDEISQAAVANRVLIQQLDTRKAESLSDGIAALAVDVKAEGDFDGVIHFLNALERGDKLIRVSSLTLTRVDRAATSGAQGGEVLSIAGTFTGYGAFPITARGADGDDALAMGRHP